MAIHLRYDVDSADDICTGHPQHVMADLGITYELAIPMSVASQWWFFACSGMPNPLPLWLTPLGLSAGELVGRYGITEELAATLDRVEP